LIAQLISTVAVCDATKFNRNAEAGDITNIKIIAAFIEEI